MGWGVARFGDQQLLTLEGEQCVLVKKTKVYVTKKTIPAIPAAQPRFRPGFCFAIALARSQGKMQNNCDNVLHYPPERPRSICSALEVLSQNFSGITYVWRTLCFKLVS